MSERIPISAEDAEEFTASLGQFVSGSYRQVALAQRMGVPQALGLSTEEWVRDRLGGYIRLSIPERREVVKELAEDGLSQRDIAGVVGVDAATVNRDISVANATEHGEIPHYDAGFVTPDVANATPEENESQSPTIEPEESPPYDAPLLSVVDLETGEVVTDADPAPSGIPDIHPIPKEAKVFEQLIRMSTVTQDAPEAVAGAAIRYYASSARNYLSRSDAVLGWHAEFVAALRAQLDQPLRAIK